jgi:hypothetical protein
VLQNVTDRLARQELFDAVRDIIREPPVCLIADASALGIGNPQVIPLLHGEGDLPTPGFIGVAAPQPCRPGIPFISTKRASPSAARQSRIT